MPERWHSALRNRFPCSLVSVLSQECRISDEINYCMYFRDIELAEENSLDVLTGQHVSIHCAGNALSFPGSEIKLGRNSSLRLVGCRVGSLHSSEDLDSIEGDGLASDQVTRLLVAEAESSLVLQDTTMRMPETVRYPALDDGRALRPACERNITRNGSASRLHCGL